MLRLTRTVLYWKPRKCTFSRNQSQYKYKERTPEERFRMEEATKVQKEYNGRIEKERVSMHEKQTTNDKSALEQQHTNSIHKLSEQELLNEKESITQRLNEVNKEIAKRSE